MVHAPVTFVTTLLGEITQGAERCHSYERYTRKSRNTVETKMGGWNGPDGE